MQVCNSSVEASISTSIPQITLADCQILPLEQSLAAANCTSFRYEWIFSHLVAVRLSINTKLGKTKTKVLTHPLGLAGVPDVVRVNPESLAAGASTALPTSAFTYLSPATENIVVGKVQRSDLSRFTLIPTFNSDGGD